LFAIVLLLRVIFLLHARPKKKERPDSSTYDYRGNGAVAGARSSLAGWLGGPLRIRKKSMVKWRWRREKAKQIGRTE